LFNRADRKRKAGGSTPTVSDGSMRHGEGPD
jgi:hypothetical protein